MSDKIYIFDSHPVQYKAPVYQAMHGLAPGLFEVIYATDASVRPGNFDKGFGVEVKWNTPLLDGYPFRVLNNERGDPLTGPNTLTGKGLFNLLKKERPKAILLTQARYHFDHAAYLSALVLGIPILIRQETQDEMYANDRSLIKGFLRGLIYRVLYAPVQHAFCFGELNKRHLIRHGIHPNAMSMAHFSVANPFDKISPSERQTIRDVTRSKLGIKADSLVVAFFGKLIPKKNPDLIYQAIQSIPEPVRKRLHLLFVGAGELQEKLDAMAAEAKAKFGVSSSFTGFINQKELPSYYLASDIVALPSRRMGEAWGLVINEALNAGCSVIMTDAVGCQYEFGSWERARVIAEGNDVSLGRAIGQLAEFPRDLHWAEAKMTAYSTDAAANEIVRVLKQFAQAA